MHKHKHPPATLAILSPLLMFLGTLKAVFGGLKKRSGSTLIYWRVPNPKRKIHGSLSGTLKISQMISTNKGLRSIHISIPLTSYAPPMTKTCPEYLYPPPLNT